MRWRIGSRHVLRGVRDWLLGAGLFLVLAAGLGGNPSDGSISRASASEGFLAQALEVTSHSGPVADNAVVAVLARAIPAAGGHRLAVFAILGLSFSLMFTFNLAFWRHLRRVYASPRRGAWGRGR